MMQRYRIKSSPEREEYLQVLRKSEAGYQVRIVRCYEGYESVTESFLEAHLFEMCLHTGYLTESPEPQAVPEHAGAARVFSVA
ncbi:MAG: hypothetical protein EA427_08630 [Spirochaetaceae bacterium]|nr:MAG: hypothetical protein EA427_08630 [Spirochaetaceae bacterium]